MEGKYFIVDGIGGSGKTKIAYRLAAGLRERGLDVVETREPGGSEAAERGRKALFDLTASKLLTGDQSVANFNLLRLITIEDVVIPSVKSGKIVVSDRGFPATLAYQTSDLADIERTDKIIEFVLRGMVPAAIFVLNISAEKALQRRRPNDPFDYKELNYWKAVVDNYQGLCEVGWGGMNWVMIDATKSEDEVACDVLARAIALV